MSRTGQDFSIVEYFAGNDGSRCGYCGSKDTNYSRGMWAHKMMTQDYQDLIDRGWRRSGKYVYKPSMEIMCCPAYTIRCQAVDFKLSKSQKKCLITVRKHLQTGIKPGDSKKGDEEDAESKNESKTKDETGSCTNDVSSTSDASDHSKSTHVKRTKLTRSGVGPDPNKPLRKKAKILRMEAKRHKQTHSAESSSLESQPTKNHQKSSNEPKSLEDYLSEETMMSTALNIKIKLIRTAPPSLEYQESFKESYELFRKYQMTIHKEPASDCTAHDFKRFLCESPLVEEYREDGPSCGYGSFHQQYWLGGVLIAVGVLDILPHSISSVYLYYNPDYNFLNLGTYSSLREIAFTRALQKEAANLKYYYMGFYIHSCPKMKYKGQIGSSFLLCPEAYTWQPIEDCRPKLDENKYIRLDNKNTADSEVDINQILTLHKGRAMEYGFYKTMQGSHADKEEVAEYGNLVGPVCAYRMLLYRS
ncbi:arginyl-tRNA--protein transferase 1-like isoform X2 [Antedon mediterranea]|uniref:arginyl-tRNA--protein transferase 1-like isoform X2 n=1 Tax=Antedon mediterranea TaxID=105859 RepID=UPI003AF42ED1